MIESNQSVNELPYRARIMMNAVNDGVKRTGVCIPNRNNAAYNCLSSSLYADLQPLQWLQQDTILSIAPLDHEEEFVAGREDIVSVITSPTKVEVVSDCSVLESESGERSTTIADFYRYQAMRAALASVGNQNGVRNQHGLCTGSLARPSLQHTPSLNEYQKPPFSYTHIIFMAIETSSNKAMTVNDIYVWCETNFPYYTQAGVGWKNSLRHNLSINKSFKKISRDGRGGPGRGAYWVVEPRERNNLIDAIRRSPCSLGNLPFLNNMYPWGSGSCYSSNLFQSSNSFKTSLTPISSTRSLISNKLHPSSDTQTGSSRGSLLRIGGKITDASQLIRSSPAIHQLNDSSTNIIELSKTPQIISTMPLIQFEHITFEAEGGQESTVAESVDNECQVDDSHCKGTVVVVSCQSEMSTEFDQSYIDITRGLIENEVDRSDSGRTESIKTCPEHCKTKSNSQFKYVCHDSGVIEDILPPEDVAPLSREIIKKHCSIKQRKRCNCNKHAESESEVSGTSISVEVDLSEQSDTDYNLRKSIGRRKNCKHKKSPFTKRLKAAVNQRKLNSRSRVNNIIRAPHADHVYALLQEFLPPASAVMTVPDIEKNDGNESNSVPTEEEMLLREACSAALSKRSKHKLQIKRGSSKWRCYSDSDQDASTHSKYPSDLRTLSRYCFSVKASKRKSNKSLLRTKFLKHYSKDTERRPLRNYDDIEEQENRCYDENDNDERKYTVDRMNDVVKNEAVDVGWTECGLGNEQLNVKGNEDDFGLSFVRKNMASDERLSVKRKVGRPKKFEQDSVLGRWSAEHRVCRENISECRLKKAVKLLKPDMKYLRESNRNKRSDPANCNKEEQSAIDILVHLQRKSKQERINNMYNLSNFIERNQSDSNMS